MSIPRASPKKRPSPATYSSSNRTPSGSNVADGATIVGNRIEGSFAGIKTRGADPNRGNLIQGNVIENADVFGIRLFNDSNVVIGNTIFNPGHSGVVSEGGNHNLIGGDLAAEENEITGSGGEGAIIISGLEAQRNEVAANHGSGNEQAFLSLFPQSSSEKLNGGIEPPVFGAVLQSSAVGTAQPGATVRIFRKATAEAGELASLLAVVVVADGSRQLESHLHPGPGRHPRRCDRDE